MNLESDDLPLFRLIADELDGDDAGPAKAKFVSEAALVARAAGLIGSLPDTRLDAVVAALERELNSARHMSLADNSLRVSDMLYPYAALSGLIRPIPYYETWLDHFARSWPAIPDRPDYRACEDQFILYMAGRGNLPVFCDDSWSGFHRRIYDFGIEQCYWLTHRYIYATDMGESDIGIGWVAPALLIVIGKSVLWGNLDLFFEAAFCALSANPSRDEILLIDSLSDAFQPQLLRMLEQESLREASHELFVYSLFKLRRERLGLSGMRDDGRGETLTDFVASLASKSPDRIARSCHELRAISGHRFFAEVCVEKLAWLKAAARSKTLFENEIRSSGMEAAPGVYDEYVKRVDRNLEWILGSGHAPPPAPRANAASER